MDYEHINPWLHIWIYPRKTIRTILETNPHKHIIWLSVLAGILSGALFAYLHTNSTWSTTTRIFFMVGLLVGGGILGLISLYFEGWLYTLTGSWIRGKGTFTDLKCVVGWKNYPSILLILLNALTIWAIPSLWLEGIFSLLYVVIAIWTLVLLCHLIGEAHRFSAWRGLFTLLIAAALLLVCFMIIALLIPLLSPLFQ